MRINFKSCYLRPMHKRIDINKFKTLKRIFSGIKDKIVLNRFWKKDLFVLNRFLEWAGTGMEWIRTDLEVKN